MWYSGSKALQKPIPLAIQQLQTTQANRYKHRDQDQSSPTLTGMQGISPPKKGGGGGNQQSISNCKICKKRTGSLLTKQISLFPQVIYDLGTSILPHKQHNNPTLKKP
ncbi:hypothetical protein Dimus_023432 [Dionaea muscipula]